jgi:hypothetical protein
MMSAPERKKTGHNLTVALVQWLLLLLIFY